MRATNGIEVVLVVCIVVFSLALTPAQAITIVEQGRAKAVIVVAPEALESERYAARELSQFLAQITGATLDITAAAEEGVSRLLVGPKAAQAVEPGFTTEGLGSEGLVIKTV
ncbi:MAG: hypothetical protein HQ515_20310, partial [Phycisphaeraceae bacterium]|nr:hypothetical protein [Phycisphaeraceae bacterium]